LLERTLGELVCGVISKENKLKNLAILLLLCSPISLAQQPLILNESGLSLLNGNTAFNFMTITTALPSYQVMKSTGYTENQPYPIIKVSLYGDLLLTINSAENKIYSIITKSDKVSVHTGHKIGELFEDIYTSAEYNCHVGFEEWSGYAMCLAPNSKHIYYIFSKTNKSDAELPTTEQLNPEKIKAIFWSRGY
jgi:hypothetical protein